MLNVSQITKFIGDRILLDAITFQNDPGEVVALVGANGSGKSTLLKICAGITPSDGGEVACPRDASIGYLPQHAELDSRHLLIDELRQVFAEVLSHERELEQLGHRMSELDPASEEYAAVADRFGHLHHELERLEAYDMDARIGRIAAGLGFSTGDLDRPCHEFSGGWRMRVLLAKLLLRNHDVLLLDEPTNHLDLETMLWLEEWIQTSDSTVIMVSHERAFMDNLAQRTFELHEGQLTIYRGNYSEYLRQREERWAQWAREYTNQQEEVERIERFIERFRAKATKAVQVQSRIKQLEKIERLPPPPSEPPAIHFRFPQPDRGSKEVFVAEELEMAFGELKVLEAVNFAVWRGERVAIVGLNGAGKSTLLKLMIGRLKPTRGRIERGKATTVEYFAQYDFEGMAANNSVWNEVSSVAPMGMDQQVRNLMGGFFFRGDDLDKRIEVLSGGERTRVRLAKMLFSGANTLLLDEPTNHLDLASRRTLEQSMLDFPGTLVFVSHDRVFLETVPTRILEVKDRMVRSFPGNYTDYCRALAALGEESPLVDRAHRESSGSRSNGARPHRPTKVGGAVQAQDVNDAQKIDKDGLSRDERKSLQRDRRRLEREIELVMEAIAEAENQLKAIEAQLMSPSVYTDPQKASSLGNEQKVIKDKLARLEEEWESKQAALPENI